MFATVQPVTYSTPLMAPIDADRLIASVNAALKPCTREQASALVLELIAGYPQLILAKQDADTRLYQAKLLEAFAKYSHGIGKRIVNGADGIPGKVAFKPQPSDVVAFAEREQDKLRNVLTMAMRHKAEHQRRADDRARDQQCGTPEQRKARVAALAAEFKAKAVLG